MPKPLLLSTPSAGVTRFYFHGNKRCKTCLRIERMPRETCETSFAAALKTKRRTLRTVNLDESQNDHGVIDRETRRDRGRVTA